jgi:signal transduction histidine kinase
MTRLDVAQLIAGVGELTRGAAESRRVHLALPADPHLEVFGDRRRLLQVLQNLVSNAIQHAPSESTVSLAVNDLTIERMRWVEFEVMDEGIGFAPADLPRLFEPFFSRRPGGTGLGLALAHRLVHDHGGTIVANNRDNGGACVAVRIPAASKLEHSPPHTPLTTDS